MSIYINPPFLLRKMFYLKEKIFFFQYFNCVFKNVWKTFFFFGVGGGGGFET